MAQSLSINIHGPVAGEEVDLVVPVSGTLSVVGTGFPLIVRVDRVDVQFGAGGPVVQAQITGSGNQGAFPRSFSCSGPLPTGVHGGQPLTITVTAFGQMREQ